MGEKIINKGAKRFCTLCCRELMVNIANTLKGKLNGRECQVAVCEVCHYDYSHYDDVTLQGLYDANH